MRTWLSNGLVILILLVSGCGDDEKAFDAGSQQGGEDAADGVRPSSVDAADIFLPLPRGYSYGPPPAGERERLEELFASADLKDIEIRRIRSRGGAAIVIGAVATPSSPATEMREGFEQAGGKLTPQRLAGAPFLVGVDAFEHDVAIRRDGVRFIVIYAASPSDLRLFAKPFARSLYQ